MQTEEAIRLLVVDDEPLVREALEFVLDIPSIRVVGTAEDGPSAIKAVEELSPEVVLMDVRMPGMSGIEATREITAKFPDVIVLVHSAHSDQRSKDEATQAGAAGYVVKGDRMDQLIARIVEAARGDGQRE